MFHFKTYVMQRLQEAVEQTPRKLARTKIENMQDHIPQTLPVFQQIQQQQTVKQHLEEHIQTEM